LAKSRYSHKKREKELVRMEKQARKQQRKQEKKLARQDTTPEQTSCDSQM